MSHEFHHLPVMVDEIVELFGTVPAGYVLDATLGGGGHSEALLTRWPHIGILGIDRDGTALAAAQQRLARFGDRVKVYRCRFDRLEQAMEALSIETLSGALFDLGVSSPQLDRADRGFSYRNDADLDMRMDQDQMWSAKDVVNGYTAEQLMTIIAKFGDERFAKRIANAIVAARPIDSTAELAEVVTAAIPAAARRTGGHPAKRTFQAIRVEVNGELEALPVALAAAVEHTTPGGRIAVLSYHSGEDRIVKQAMMSMSTGDCPCPPELPCVCDAVQTVRIVRNVPRTPSKTEQLGNRRAASARLRVV
ncbi:MAG TPA: 16S rRNA (cytosine(1402)-N(4))-methyltransferase RsmH, partial [Ilumatobacteraceae bacterium]|nr:16S rRNA (cytosine(1402)-N(4))-methyltransferase RsmH [Ilumatobacteraceae bacterium]